MNKDRIVIASTGFREAIQNAKEQELECFGAFALLDDRQASVAVRRYTPR